MSGQVVSIDVHPNFRATSPKGSVWLVHYREFRGGAERTVWSFVADEVKGLTAHEAWEQAKLPGSPAFCKVSCMQLSAFPLSVDTKAGMSVRDSALEAFKKLAGLP